MCEQNISAGCYSKRGRTQKDNALNSLKKYPNQMHKGLNLANEQSFFSFFRSEDGLDIESYEQEQRTAWLSGFPQSQTEVYLTQ